jgi:hypothetical protein
LRSRPRGMDLEAWMRSFGDGLVGVKDKYKV